MVAGGVSDCGTSDRLPTGTSSDCAFAVGQRLSTTSAYAFDGRIIGARLYPDVALYVSAPRRLLHGGSTRDALGVGAPRWPFYAGGRRCIFLYIKLTYAQY